MNSNYFNFISSSCISFFEFDKPESVFSTVKNSTKESSKEKLRRSFKDAENVDFEEVENSIV